MQKQSVFHAIFKVRFLLKHGKMVCFSIISISKDHNKGICDSQIFQHTENVIVVHLMYS